MSSKVHFHAHNVGNRFESRHILNLRESVGRLVGRLQATDGSGKLGVGVEEMGPGNQDY